MCDVGREPLAAWRERRLQVDLQALREVERLLGGVARPLERGLSQCDDTCRAGAWPVVVAFTHQASVRGRSAG